MSSGWPWSSSKPARSKNLAVQRYGADSSKDGEQWNEEDDDDAMQITGNEVSLAVNETRGSTTGGTTGGTTKSTTRSTTGGTTRSTTGSTTGSTTRNTTGGTTGSTTRNTTGGTTGGTTGSTTSYDPERSSKHSADRASPQRSSETDYRARNKELERREQESRKRYEQQLAEKDRTLQEMKSRLAQEERRAGETNNALNLEVQRLKSELHQMREQLNRHSQENMVYKDEIRRAEAQHETTKKLVEEQTNELKGARAFLGHSNMLSGADVVAMVDRLNTEVYQGAASMVDTFEFEGQNRRMNDEARRKATDDASKTIGGELMYALITQCRKDKDDYDPTLVQFALQTCLVFCCWKICMSWALGDENSLFIKRIYDDIQKNGS